MKTMLLLLLLMLPCFASYAEVAVSPYAARAHVSTTASVVQPTTVLAVVTAYCPCPLCCGARAHGETSTGVKTAEHPYGIAVPRQFIHSRITVPGYGTFNADDTGGAMNGDMKKGVIHIDVRFPTHAEALQWGKQRLIITIAERAEEKKN